MLFANDEQQCRVSAFEAVSSLRYYCPVCGKPVLLRRGQVNIPHFAHHSGECTDTWSYDMSEWHRKMQMYFPADAREVVVHHRGRTHRADVLVGNTVIEMQHSPITAEEFNDRNNFFKAAGYRLAWVFDMREKFESGQLEYLNYDSDHKYKWANPMRIFSALPGKLSDYDKQFAVYMNFYDDCDDAENLTFIERIIWSAGNDEDYVDLSRLVTSDALVLGASDFTVDDMFISMRDRRRRYAQQALDGLKRRCVDEHFGYQLKYCGVRGKKRNDYICPKTQKFGIPPFGETSCTYCKYCYFQMVHEEYDSKQRVFYCCYPHAVRECNGGHPGYECDSADEYLI